MKVALSEGVFGEKMMVDSVFNGLDNDQGWHSGKVFQKNGIFH